MVLKRIRFSSNKGSALLVLTYLDLVSEERGEEWVKIPLREIATDINATQKTVLEAIKVLESSGELAVQRQDIRPGIQDTHRYKVVTRGLQTD